MLEISSDLITTGQVQLVVYVDDQLVKATNQNFHVRLEQEPGWHSIRLECTSDLLSEVPFETVSCVQLNNFSVNGASAWPIDAGHTLTPPVPFDLMQAHCHSRFKRYSMCVKNKIHVESFVILNVKLKDGHVVDHYYDRGDPTDVEAYPSDAWIFDNRIPQYLDKFSMVWSDVYQGYVHRMVFEDHFILKHDPADISTYGAKWRGVYVEATPRALDEACNRTSMMADVRDIKLGKLKITGSKFFDKYREKIIEHINATPLESRLFVDYARDDETSNIISEAGHMVICDKWMVRHVFSAYMDDTLPPEFVAFLFKIV